MPQVLKPELRARILSAGLEVFAAQGYLGATMTAIAEQAGLGAASLYRYFPSKAELFEAAITPELAARFGLIAALCFVGYTERVRAQVDLGVVGVEHGRGRRNAHVQGLADFESGP